MSEPTTPPDDAVELLRAWLVNDSLECSVRAGVFADPALWGAVLADVARNVAAGLHEEEGADQAQTLRLIAEAFARELAEPSGESP
jgi:hypothetical protein